MKDIGNNNLHNKQIGNLPKPVELPFLKIGDVNNGNYSEFESDGTLVSNGDATCWKDINIDVSALGSPPGLQPDVVQFVDKNGSNTGVYTYGMAIGEAVGGKFEIQHDYKTGEDIYFHIHSQGIAAPTGVDKIKFELDYTIAKNNELLEPVQTISLEFDYDTRYELIVNSFPVIDGSNIGIGDQFIFTLRRVAASSDDYAGDALLMTVGIHYQVDTIGSRQIFIK